jgi:hypothetical protein
MASSWFLCCIAPVLYVYVRVHVYFHCCIVSPVLRCPTPRWRNGGVKHIDGPDCAIPVGSDTVVPV